MEGECTPINVPSRALPRLYGMTDSDFAFLEVSRQWTRQAMKAMKKRCLVQDMIRSVALKVTEGCRSDSSFFLLVFFGAGLANGTSVKTKTAAVHLWLRKCFGK